MSGHPEADIYHRQGMGNLSGIGDRPALVIVDFVAGFSDPAHFGGGNIGPAIEETVRLLAFARRQHWPVAHTRVVYAEDGSDAGVGRTSGGDPFGADTSDSAADPRSRGRRSRSAAGGGAP